MRRKTAGRLYQPPTGSRLAFHRNALQWRRRAFTLIELLVVIAIIIILAGLLIPAFNAVQSQAKRTQAKNDLTQIVTAVNAFYTDYGRYPIDPAWGCTTTEDVCFSWDVPGAPQCGPYNDKLLNELRACTATDTSCSSAATQNTRQIVYISPPAVKDPNNPKSGISTVAGNAPQGTYYDPWGSPYIVEIDANYNNSVPNPYIALGGTGAGPNPVGQGVIAWSNGADTLVGGNPENTYTNSDDVISWQ
jgi:prepilin-type N-terminal cleavage/methylation domain-containing protein